MNKQLRYFSAVYVQRNLGGRAEVFANKVPPPPFVMDVTELAAM
jgi:hypothetical protein